MAIYDRSDPLEVYTFSETGKFNYNKTLKLIITGHHGVGKTWLQYKYCQETPDVSIPSTCCIDLRTTTIQPCLGKDTTVNTYIYDASGQERFEAIITGTYFKHAPGFILVFDVTNEYSFDRAFQKWLEYIRTKGPKHPVIVLVGTKCDLKNEREVSQERAQIVTDELGLKYFEVSSVSGQNVDLVFKTITQQIIQTYEELASSTRVPSTLNQ